MEKKGRREGKGRRPALVWGFDNLDENVINIYFLPMPLAVVWAFRLTFSPPPSPSSSLSPSPSSHFQLFVSVSYRKRRGGHGSLASCLTPNIKRFLDICLFLAKYTSVMHMFLSNGSTHSYFGASVMNISQHATHLGVVILSMFFHQNPKPELVPSSSSPPLPSSVTFFNIDFKHQ